MIILNLFEALPDFTSNNIYVLLTKNISLGRYKFFTLAADKGKNRPIFVIQSLPDVLYYTS